MREVWKDIKDYEGLYQVSNLGRVKSLDRYVSHKKFGKKFCGGGLMAIHINNTGYATVNLCKNNKYKSFSVHRLVAIAFIENPDKLPQVNHKDENKENNHIDNLEWCNESYNNSYGTKIQRQNKKIKLPIIQCDLNGNYIREWKSATDAEMELNNKFTGAISRCINGRSKTAYGYKWKFKEVK